MNLEEFKNHKCYKYAEWCIEEDNNNVGIYIKKVAKQFLDDLENESDEFEYIFNYKQVRKIEKLLGLINFATGSVANKSAKEMFTGYQWFLILNIFCWRLKTDPKKRRYQTVLLHMARKNSKTVLIAIILILELLLEPKFSQMFSGANNREQAKLIFADVSKIIRSSPHIAKHFKILRDSIECKLTNSIFKPLAADFNSTDGLLPTMAILDEVGSFKSAGLIESLQSGMLSVQNRLMIQISTSYPNRSNPFLDVTEYAKRVIDGEIEDATIFALLYQMDKDDDLDEDFNVIAKANPLQWELPDGREYLSKEYAKAVEIGGMKLTSFITKHANKWLDNVIGETFIEQEKLLKCEEEIDSFDWYDLDGVIIGVDLAFTSDNIGISCTYYDSDTELIHSKNFCVLPGDRVEEKSNRENLNYYDFINKEYAFTSGDSYNSIHELFDIIKVKYIEKYRWKNITFVIDNYNATGFAEICDAYRYDITVIRLKNNSYGLAAGINLLLRTVEENKFRYEYNPLLPINFNNAKATYDTNMTKYVNKKLSNGKIDLCFSLFNALTIIQLNINEELGTPDFIMA